MNEYIFDGDKCHIVALNKTHGNMLFTIDMEDYPRVHMFKWRVGIKEGNKPYCRAYFRSSGQSHNILLHRLITSFDWEVVDHINRDTLDNTKKNLRDGSNGVNSKNRGQTKNKLLPIGVYSSGNNFRACISRNKVKINLGTFKTIELAEKAYLEFRNRSSEL